MVFFLRPEETMPMDLFSAPDDLSPIVLPDGELAFLRQLPFELGNEEVLARLLAETGWQAQSITLWGKSILQPRLTAWHGQASYSYSGLKLDPLPFSPLQLALKV